MSLMTEFKEFAMKGNVVDMAVGVVIGGAFGKIVSSFVGDIVMPLLGKLVGGVNFAELSLSLGTDPAGAPVLLKYGAFLQSAFDFVIIAAAILFYFGSGPVRGFAVTLAIGIATSMFTSVTVTRLIIAAWFNRYKPKALPI